MRSPTACHLQHGDPKIWWCASMRGPTACHLQHGDPKIWWCALRVTPRPQDQRSCWCRSQFKGRRRPMFPVHQPEGRFSLPLLLLFSSVPQRIKWCPPRFGRILCFTQSTNSDSNLVQKHPPKHTQKHLTKYLGILWPIQINIKLTITRTLLTLQ